MEEIDDRLEWRLEGQVARITLARPAARNAIDLRMAEALIEGANRIERLADAGTVRAVILDARGQAFSVGGDLREFAGSVDLSAHIARVADALHEAIATLNRAPVPIVSSVHATAAGGGVGIALAADIVLVAREAKLQLAYTAAGLSPDGGASWHLPQILGLPRALDLGLTNRAITGAEAAAWGIASRAVDAAELAATAGDTAALLASGSTPALAATKRLMRTAPGRSSVEQMAEESRTIAELAQGPDAGEGITAFLEKRTPAFGGS